MTFLEENRIYEEDGKCTVLVGLDDLLDFVFNKNVMVIVPTFFGNRSFPWINEAVLSPDCKVLCTKKGVVTSIRASRKRRTCWIVSCEAWSVDPDSDEFEFLSELRELFEYLGVGTCPTPSSLGMKLMQISFGKYDLAKHNQPGGYVKEFITKNLVGGRVDTPMEGERFDNADLFDMSSAYLAHFGHQPTGTAIFFKRLDRGYFPEWFARCEIEVYGELPIGPFPVRLKGKSGRVVYPTMPGKYTAFLWRSQVEDCYTVGLKVSIYDGVGWTGTTDDPLHWCRDIFTAKVIAAAQGRPILEKNIKKVIVSAIGRHGSKNVYYTLVPEGEEDELDLHVSAGGESYAYFVHEELNVNSANMIHWYSYTLMQCARSLYHFAEPYAEQGRLIATNYDCAIVVEGDESHQYVKKYSPESWECAPGTWLYMQLHNLWVKNPRTFISDEMDVQPGVKR